VVIAELPDNNISTVYISANLSGMKDNRISSART